MQVCVYFKVFPGVGLILCYHDASKSFFGVGQWAEPNGIYNYGMACFMLLLFFLFSLARKSLIDTTSCTKHC